MTEVEGAELRRVDLDLFVEDAGHEYFFRALVARLGRDVGVDVAAKTVTAAGGAPKVFDELRLYQQVSPPRAAALVVGIDGNCKGWQARVREVTDAVEPGRYGTLVVGCPDPHVERWYLADPESLRGALGVSITRTRKKCERGLYKRLLVAALRAAEHPVRLGGVEFATEIVDAMDLYRAGKNEPSLRSFVDGLRQCLKTA